MKGCSLEEKWIVGAVEEREPGYGQRREKERDQEREVYRGLYKENTSLKPVRTEMRGAGFCEIFSTSGSQRLEF